MGLPGFLQRILPKGRKEPVRYSILPLPAYRYIPGETPHPNRSPKTHPVRFPLSDPKDAAPLIERPEWRYGVDLFNHGYWWESHEAFETLWLELGRTTPDARFFQGLILLAGSLIKRRTGQQQIAEQFLQQAKRWLLDNPAPPVMLDVTGLVDQAEAVLHGERVTPPRIVLDG